MATTSTSTTTTTNLSRPRIRRISARHPLFKAGIGGLIFAVVLFAVGFAAPAWYDGHGLWISCRTRDPVICSHEQAWMLIGWFEAVRVLETLALMGFLLSLAVELYQDVLAYPPPLDNKAVEILAAVAGALGLAGVTVFSTTGMTYVQSADGRFWRTGLRLGWGVWLTTVSCLLAVLSAAMLACGRRRHTPLTSQVLAPSPVPLLTFASSTTHETPAAPDDTTPTLGLPATSSVPVYYVIVQGHLVPAYKEVSSENPAVLEAVKSEP